MELRAAINHLAGQSIKGSRQHGVGKITADALINLDTALSDLLGTRNLERDKIMDRFGHDMTLSDAKEALPYYFSRIKIKKHISGKITVEFVPLEDTQAQELFHSPILL